jgi:nucleoside-diphosphate kinase
MDKIFEQSLVVIKPDGMERGLIGDIIHRFERVGLRVVNAKMVEVTRELAETHYPVTDEWLSKVGNNTLSDCQKYEVDAQETMGTTDPLEIGKLVHEWNVSYLMQKPVLALVIEGVHAIEVIRKLCGSTLPLLAAPGTIRGDYSSASALSGNVNQQSIQNLIHASGERDEAEREIELWFGKKD